MIDPDKHKALRRELYEVRDEREQLQARCARQQDSIERLRTLEAQLQGEVNELEAKCAILELDKTQQQEDFDTLYKERNWYHEQLEAAREESARQQAAAKMAVERITWLDDKVAQQQERIAGLSEGIAFPLDEETRFILSRMMWDTAPIARRLRELGQDIERKAEYEQAAAFHFLINLYLRHGKQWREELNEALQLKPTPHPAESEGK